MSIIVAQSANDQPYWPCYVFNVPAQSNLSAKEVRLLLTPFAEQHPFVNVSILCATQYPVVNVASFPEIWVGKVEGRPEKQKPQAGIASIQMAPPGGDALSTGVQVPFSVPEDPLDRKYPLLPENLAL